MSMDNELALVTGASRGIGRAIALALGSKGARVVGTATSQQGAEKISEFFKQNSIQGMGLKLDVTDQSSIDEMFATMGNSYGSPSILVNNAGITQDNLLVRMKEQEWDNVINTNLSSVYRLSKACMRSMMKARKGRIITISSVVGLSGNAGQTNYAAAKAGILGLTKSLAREVGLRSITVNAIAPGFIDTDMTKQLSDDQRETLCKNIPLQRLGQPEDIAAAVVFLASTEAGYISGETLNVNGGLYMA